MSGYPSKRGLHSGKRMMLVRGIGLLPAPVPQPTRDVGSRALHCDRCELPVLTAEPQPLCPKCKQPLTPTSHNGNS